MKNLRKEEAIQNALVSGVAKSNAKSENIYSTSDLLLVSKDLIIYIVDLFSLSKGDTAGEKIISK